MAIQSIISQPATGSLRAAYRPIIISAVALTKQIGLINTGPAAMYCDIYVAGVYYGSVSSTSTDLTASQDNVFTFDISRRVQEILNFELPPVSSSEIFKNPSTCKEVYCLLRPGYIGADGFLAFEYTEPKRATATTPAVNGTGYQTNSFYVANACLQHRDNQNLESHLSFFKQGDWATEAYPLSHGGARTYKLSRKQSAYFPFVYTGSKCFSKLIINYDILLPGVYPGFTIGYSLGYNS